MRGEKEGSDGEGGLSLEALVDDAEQMETEGDPVAGAPEMETGGLI
jgi:hypothetical protein